MVAAVLLAASPHLARPVRQLGWALVIMAGKRPRPRSGSANPAGRLRGWGSACSAPAGVLLVVGSPRGYPAVASVAEALTHLGLPLTTIQIDPDQSWGVRRMIGVGATTADWSRSRPSAATPPTPSWRPGSGGRSSTGGKAYPDPLPVAGRRARGTRHRPGGPGRCPCARGTGRGEYLRRGGRPGHLPPRSPVGHL